MLRSGWWRYGCWSWSHQDPSRLAREATSAPFAPQALSLSEGTAQEPKPGLWRITSATSPPPVPHSRSAPYRAQTWKSGWPGSLSSFLLFPVCLGTPSPSFLIYDMGITLQETVFVRITHERKEFGTYLLATQQRGARKGAGLVNGPLSQTSVEILALGRQG